MRVDLAELCFHLRHRRRMYVGDDRFLTVVAFVEGYNAARDAGPLSGFPDFVSMRLLGHHSNLHWSAVIASTEVPGVLETDAGLNGQPQQVQLGWIHRLLDLLDDYRDESSSPHVRSDPAG
jgi:hypothetical protein